LRDNHPTPPARKRSFVQVPVVLIVFNRPETTRRTVEAIRRAEPSHLFVIGDGPRHGRADDAKQVAATRAVVASVDWGCPVEWLLREENIGLEPNVELGLDRVFAQVDRALVFEDDCVADPSFFPFAAELLERYRDDRRVWQIAGNTLGVPRHLFGDDSYRFSTWASVWGWATWADRWHRHRELFPRDHTDGSWLESTEPPVRTKPPVPQPGTLVTRSAERHFAEAAASADGLAHGWDKHWWLTIMSEGGMCVVPAANLVENIGLGAESTHGLSTRLHEPAASATFPLRHPAAVGLDVEVERELELTLSRVGGRGAQLARRIVRSPRLRTLLLRLADSRFARFVSRTISRLTG
jgi:hypothetical protein